MDSDRAPDSIYRRDLEKIYEMKLRHASSPLRRARSSGSRGGPALPIASCQPDVVPRIDRSSARNWRYLVLSPLMPAGARLEIPRLSLHLGPVGRNHRASEYLAASSLSIIFSMSFRLIYGCRKLPYSPLSSQSYDTLPTGWAAEMGSGPRCTFSSHAQRTRQGHREVQREA